MRSQSESRVIERTSSVVRVAEHTEKENARAAMTQRQKFAESADVSDPCTVLTTAGPYGDGVGAGLQELGDVVGAVEDLGFVSEKELGMFCERMDVGEE
jgi:hypothetical protein